MRREIRVRKERDEKIQVNERDNCIAEVCIGNNTKLLFSPSIMFYEKYKKKKENNTNVCTTDIHVGQHNFPCFTNTSLLISLSPKRSLNIATVTTAITTITFNSKNNTWLSYWIESRTVWLLCASVLFFFLSVYLSSIFIVYVVNVRDFSIFYKIWCNFIKNESNKNNKKQLPENVQIFTVNIFQKKKTRKDQTIKNKNF